MKINRNILSHKPPYTVVLIDATDAYYYADIMGEWKEIDKVNDFGKAKALADALFVQKNYKWKSLEEMNNCDGGFDVRIYDQNHACVYAAHEKFKEQWIGSEPVLTLHGKDAEMAFKAFFVEKGQKSNQKSKPRSKSKLAANIAVLLFSVFWILAFLASSDRSSTAFGTLLFILLVGNGLLWLFVIGVAKLLSKVPARKIKIELKYPTIGLVLLLFIIAFYWFSIRPSNIRSGCVTYARSKASDYPAIENNYFRLCLVEHGMQSESMFVNVGR